jgi:hypothetical protein
MPVWSGIERGSRPPRCTMLDEPVSPPGHGVRGVTSEVGPMQCSVPPALKQGVPPWSRGFNQVKGVASPPSTARRRSHSGRWHVQGRYRVLPSQQTVRSSWRATTLPLQGTPTASKRQRNAWSSFRLLRSCIGDMYTRQWRAPHSDKTLRSCLADCLWPPR